PRCAGGKLAGGKATVSLPSVGQLWGGSGAAAGCPTRSAKANSAGTACRPALLALICMDRTSIIAIVVCFVLIGLWSFVIVPKLNPPRPLPPGATNAPPTALTATNQGAPSPPAP